jgi:hypothetical protein
LYNCYSNSCSFKSINAIDDTPAAVNTGVNPTIVLNVTDNDTLNNVQVAPTTSV